MKPQLHRVTVHTPRLRHSSLRFSPGRVPALPRRSGSELGPAPGHFFVRHIVTVKPHHHPRSVAFHQTRVELIRKTTNYPASLRADQQHCAGSTATSVDSAAKASGKSYHQPPLKGSLASPATVITVVVVGLVAALVVVAQTAVEDPQGPPQPSDLDIMSASNPAGRPGNLTAEQEEKLRQFWQAIFQVCGVKDPSESEASTPAETKESPDAGEQEASKKKRFGLFNRKKRSESKAAATGSSQSTPASGDSTEDDKYGQTQQYHETLAKQSPESIRNTIWTMVKCDHPDALALRFLRARKWDIEKALVMMVSTMNWRQADMHLDDDVMIQGEAGAVRDEKEGDADAKTLGRDFLAQVRLGKSFLHGTDNAGRPICVVRVRLHKQGEQCEASLERYTVYLIETARFVLTPPVDTATIVFDMTHFTLANMDYTPVKFMVKVFEANYPESLGVVLVHNAPWVFQGIWKIIRGWLDPVVASKIHFTNNKKDLEEFIEPGHIIKELGGNENWEYKYTEPVEGENDKMKDTETRDRLLAERETMVKEFEATTMQWIRNPDGDDVKEIKAKREKLATQLRQDYWKLDPYVRARSLYDRDGSLYDNGKVDWYSDKTKETEKPAAAPTAAPAAETSADDVD